MNKLLRNSALGLLAFLLAACSALEATPEPTYLPYVFVTAAGPSPTPFQPGELSPFAASQSTPQAATVLQATATIPPPQPTATAFPTPTNQPAQPTPAVMEVPQPLIDAPETITFLLLGSDLRPGSSYRTDTIVIAAVRPRDGQVSLISVPRDLWVTIPSVGLQRINTAYQYGEIYGYAGGGPGLLKDTLQFNFGLQIDHTAMVDFDGFRRIVDTLGGVQVPVYCPYTDWRLISPNLDPENENNWALYTAGPGLIHMDGDLALWYARSRQKSNDFDRGRRQQEVLRALYGQMLTTNAIANIPQLYTDLSGSIRTDLGLGDILQLSPMALNLTNADIRSYYIAGNLITPWTTPGGAYVLLPNTEAIQAMLAQALSKSPRQEERQAIRIEVQNGSAYDGWDKLAAERLNYAGYATSFNVADHRQHTTTLLYDLTALQDRQASASLLAVLGLPPSALVSVPNGSTEIQYALIVGNDYQPCFKPAEMTP